MRKKKLGNSEENLEENPEENPINVDKTPQCEDRKEHI